MPNHLAGQPTCHNRTHILPLKKAHAGQKGWTGPRYLSPDIQLVIGDPGDGTRALVGNVGGDDCGLFDLLG
jgi:hypothetical protein